MKDRESYEIIKRFFKAFEILKDCKITNRHHFCNLHNINRRNFYMLEKCDISAFELSWLKYLAVDYKVNVRWILTGDGPFFETPFTKEAVKSMQKRCTPNEEVIKVPDNKSVVRE